MNLDERSAAHTRAAFLQALPRTWREAAATLPYSASAQLLLGYAQRAGPNLDAADGSVQGAA